MVPACSVGALLEYIEDMSMEMNWSKEIPQVDGWYWVYMNYGGTAMEYIYADEETGEMWTGLYQDAVPATTLYAKYEPLFYGPLKRPELPK